MARLDVGRLMNLRGKYAEAVDELEQVLLIRTRVDGPTNHWVQQTRYVLADALFASGNLDRSRALLDEALEIAAADPKQNVRVLMLRTRAALAREQQRPADALADLELALQIATDLHGPRDQRTATLQVVRAETLVALGPLKKRVGSSPMPLKCWPKPRPIRVSRIRCRYSLRPLQSTSHRDERG